MSTGTKLSTPLKYYSTATFTGRGFFPLDMLRYDSCYPTSGDDVSAIGNTFQPMPASERQVFSIRVTKCHETKDPQWTDDRWRSFGWSRVRED